MTNDQKIVVKTTGGGGALGPIWVIGWLFTIGYLHLPLLNSLYAIILWPYYLGVHFAHA
jgi:hypothetical protein